MYLDQSNYSRLGGRMRIRRDVRRIVSNDGVGLHVCGCVVSGFACIRSIGATSLVLWCETRLWYRGGWNWPHGNISGSIILICRFCRHRGNCPVQPNSEAGSWPCLLSDLYLISGRRSRADCITFCGLTPSLLRWPLRTALYCHLALQTSWVPPAATKDHGVDRVDWPAALSWA